MWLHCLLAFNLVGPPCAVSPCHRHLKPAAHPCLVQFVARRPAKKSRVAQSLQAMSEYPAQALSKGQTMKAFLSQDISQPTRTGPRAGIRGWLLALCLMLTVVGPLISVWLMAEQHAAWQAQLESSMGLRMAFVVCLLAATGSALFGVYAGVRLWRVLPNAVNTTKSALLAGLAADIVITVIEVAVAQPSTAGGNFLDQTVFQLVPCLIFFTVCFAYLQRSRRVDVTFRPGRSDG